MQFSDIAQAYAEPFNGYQAKIKNWLDCFKLIYLSITPLIYKWIEIYESTPCKPRPADANQVQQNAPPALQLSKKSQDKPQRVHQSQPQDELIGCAGQPVDHSSQIEVPAKATANWTALNEPAAPQEDFYKFRIQVGWVGKYVHQRHRLLDEGQEQSEEHDWDDESRRVVVAKEYFLGFANNEHGERQAVPPQNRQTTQSKKAVHAEGEHNDFK